MAIIREHLAHKGLGLHNDLQNESSIVGNFPTVLMMRDFGTGADRRVDARLPRRHAPPRVRADRTESRLRRDLPRDDRGPGRRRVGDQRPEALQLGAAPRDARHRVRTSGDPGSPVGITAFLVPTDAPGLQRRLLLVDVQHADRPRRGDAARRACRRRCSDRSIAASSSPSTSCTRTASARPRRRSVPRSSASTKPSRTRTRA